MSNNTTADAQQIEVREEDLLQPCPSCKDKSVESLDAECDACEGSGSVLTPLGCVINALVRRERIIEFKRRTRSNELLMNRLFEGVREMLGPDTSTSGG